jgi:CHC2 zinc finger
VPVPERTITAGAGENDAKQSTAPASSQSAHKTHTWPSAVRSPAGRSLGAQATYTSADVFRPWQRFTVEELVGRGPALDGNARRGGAVPAADPASGAAPLRRIPPGVYVHALTGQHVGRNRKISRPLHDDRTPSLHVYDDPERGWYCFGCGRGGSIYDLAAALYFSGQSPEVLLRGERFIEVRARLMAMFFPAGAG